MKTLTSILVSVLLMITSAIAVPVKTNNTPKKGLKSHPVIVTDQINGLIGYPNELLQGNNQSVIVIYELDENSVIHVKDILTSNTELKTYILKHIDGKKIKNAVASTSEEIVKIHFVADKEQKYFFQY